MSKRDRNRNPVGGRSGRPPLFDAVIEAVSSRYWAFFEAHPDQRVYLRRYVPGEFGERGRGLSQDLTVAVENYGGHFRTRRQALPLAGDFTYLYNQDGSVVTDQGAVFVDKGELAMHEGHFYLLTAPGGRALGIEQTGERG